MRDLAPTPTGGLTDTSYNKEQLKISLAGRYALEASNRASKSSDINY